MIIREGSRITKISLIEIERQEEIRRRLEELTSANSAHFETLKNILGGNKLVILKSGDIEVEIIDGSIGNDLKGNDKVGVNINGSGMKEEYRIFPWGLGELYAYPHDSLVTGIKDINRSLDNLAHSFGYPEWFCNKVSEVVNFVTQFMESSQATYYRDYPRPIQRA